MGGSLYPQLGLAGLVGSLLVIVVREAFKDLRSQRDQAQHRVDAERQRYEQLNDLIREKYIPALEQTRLTILEAHELIATLRAELRVRRHEE